MNSWASQKQGFTIVELLIVVVVIAILAAITIVGYNGIQNRAKASALQSSLSQQAKKLSVWKIENNDTFPIDLSTAQSQGMLTSTADVEYVGYIVSTDGSYYCATAQRSDGVKYSVTSTTSTAVEGECITNYLTNTSVELNTTNLQNIGNATDRQIAQRPVGDAFNGGNVLRITAGASGSIAGYGSTSGSLPPGRYTGSLWMRSNTSIAVVPYFEGGSTRTTVAQAGTTTLSTEWKRVWRTIDITAAGTVKVGFLASGTTASGNYVELDGFSLTPGATLYDFSDGASTGWTWLGASQASTSVGPAAIR